MNHIWLPLAFILIIYDLNAQSIGAVRFKKTMLAAESYESVAVFDVDNDGQLDIISGSYWYQGPDFKNRKYIGEVKRFGSNDYWDEFLIIPIDVNEDGWMDYVTGGWFSEALFWRENPGKKKELWKTHLIDSTGHVESGFAYDINGGGIEIYPNTTGSLKFYKRDMNHRGKPLFKKIIVSEKQRSFHGLGIGDINDDKIPDIITSYGWYEGVEEPYTGEWKLFDEFDLGDASIPIIVADVNGDGLNDLIVGQSHGYGLHWYEQTLTTNKNRKWIKHIIDDTNSQFHTMKWVDIDGDNQKELITGKRYFAHNGLDPGGFDSIGLYYYKWNGEHFSKNIISFGPLGEGKGTGVFFTIADLHKNGRKDIIVAGKDGLYIFYNMGH